MLALKLYDLNKGEVYNPHILLNPYAWSEEDFVVVDDVVKGVLEWKLRYLYNDGQPRLVRKSLVIASQQWELVEIEMSKEQEEKFKKQFPSFLLEEEKVKELLYYAVKNKLYDDLCYQIVVKTLLHKEEVKQADKVVEDKERLFDLPFELYFKTVLQMLNRGDITYEELDNVVIKKTSRFYYNAKLPTPYLPLLAREHIQTPDGNTWAPRLWQLYFLYHEVDKKMNLVLSSRQSGKTLVSTLIAFLHLMRNERADILYVVESEDKLEQPYQYFVRGLQKYAKAGIFGLSKSDKTIKCKITGNTLKFMSAGARSGLKSFSAPIVIFDEASFLPADAYMSTLPMWSKENGKFYAFTTVDWKAREHGTEWFYDLFKSIELGQSDVFNEENSLLLRVTVDQNEAVSEEEKKIFSVLKRTDIARYLADYYCILSGDDNLFDKQKMISPHTKEYFEGKNVLQAVVGYDPAARQDRAGVVVGLVVNEEEKNYLAIVKDIEIVRKDYAGQITDIKMLVDFLTAKGWPVSVIMDFTGVGAGVFEMLRNAIPSTVIGRIIYTSGNQTRFKDGIHYVPKHELVDTVQVLADQGEVKISYECKTLIEQLDTYRKVGNKYEAISGYDDVVEAFMNVAFLYDKHIKKTLTLYGEGVYKTENVKPLCILPSQKTRERLRRFIY